MNRAHGGAERLRYRINLAFNFREHEPAPSWEASNIAAGAARTIMRGHYEYALIIQGEPRRRAGVRRGGVFRALRLQNGCERPLPCGGPLYAPGVVCQPDQHGQ